MNKPKAIFCWSGGKDSAYCLNKVLEDNEYEICYLLTTLNATFKRISMHGIREELLDQQVKSIGIPLLKVYVKEGTNEDYEKQMSIVLEKVKLEGIKHVIFGDIFLDDLRTYREYNLSKLSIKAVFPLWKKNTTELINDFIAKKFKTILCCVNDGFLDENWVGKEINNTFLQQLPLNIDACGENGEYHTFCYDGPIFKNPIHFTPKEIVYKLLIIKKNEWSLPHQSKTKGFWFCELIPKL